MIRVDNAELRVREAEGDAPSRTITGYAILLTPRQRRSGATRTVKRARLLLRKQ